MMDYYSSHVTLSPSSSSSPVGGVRVVGGYRMGAVLGVGTYGEVRTAVDIQTNESVAVKLIDLSRFSSETASIIKKEISILKALDHPHVIRIIAVKENLPYTGEWCCVCACTECRRMAGSTRCASCSHDVNEHTPEQQRQILIIVQELCVGGELFGLLNHTGPMSDEVARYYYRQLIEGLQHCHERGVIHRDLKPENLVLDAQFNLKIVDFGLAAMMKPAADGQNELLMDRVLHSGVGSLPYSPPEIYFQRELYGNRGYEGGLADLWSTAVILFVMLTGRPPFLRPLERTYGEHLKKDRHFVALLRGDGYSGVSQGGKEFLMRMFKLNPRDRLSIQQIKREQWFNQPTPSHEEMVKLMEEKSKKVWLTMEKPDVVELMMRMRCEQSSILGSPNLSPMASPSISAMSMSIHAISTPIRSGTPPNLSLGSPMPSGVNHSSPPPIQLAAAVAASSNAAVASKVTCAGSITTNEASSSSSVFLSPMSMLSAVNATSSPFPEADMSVSMVSMHDFDAPATRHLVLSRTPSPNIYLKAANKSSHSPGSVSPSKGYNEGVSKPSVAAKSALTAALPSSFSSPMLLLSKNCVKSEKKAALPVDDDDDDYNEDEERRVNESSSDEEDEVAEMNRRNLLEDSDDEEESSAMKAKAKNSGIAERDESPYQPASKPVAVPIANGRSSPRATAQTVSRSPRNSHSRRSMSPSSSMSPSRSPSSALYVPRQNRQTASNVLSKLPPPNLTSPASMSAPSMQLNPFQHQVQQGTPVAAANPLQPKPQCALTQSPSSRRPSLGLACGPGAPAVVGAVRLERSGSREVEAKDLFQLHQLPLPLSNYTRCVSHSTLVDILNTITSKLSASNIPHSTTPLTSSSSAGGGLSSGMLIEFVGRYEGFALNGAVYVVKSGKTQYVVDFHKRKGDILIFGSLFRHIAAALAQ